MNPIWGIDLGGTKTEGIILEDIGSLRVVERLRVASERDKGYDHLLGQIESCVDQLRDRSGLAPRAIGIGTPGILDPVRKVMKNCNTTVLNGRPLQSDLEEILGVPVILANDANCFAIAESRWGTVADKLKNPQIVFGVIMGTGVGGGIVVRGNVLQGKHGIGGEWGHMFLDESGGPCYCGKTGCVETIISGIALQNFYREKSGKSLQLEEIVDLFHDGRDHAAVETVERLCYFFGRGIANVINLIDPDAVVIGGGLGNIELLYTKGVEQVKRFVFNDCLDTLFLKPKLGDSAGVFGAALLVTENSY